MIRWLSRQSQPTDGPPCGEWFSADGINRLCSLTAGHDGPHRGRPFDPPHDESESGTVE